jgi:hypothetical protein
MFVIYFFAANGLKQSECESLFGEDKSVLISRYCTAAQRALITADFISSPNLMSLQAFVLFLVSAWFLLATYDIFRCTDVGTHRPSMMASGYRLPKIS